MTKWDFSQECKFGLTSKNQLIYPINKIKGKNPHISMWYSDHLSGHTKTFDKILTIKTFRKKKKRGFEGNVLNLIKGNYQKTHS